MGQIKEAIEQVLKLQLQYSPSNTAEMRIRRSVINEQLKPGFEAAVAGRGNVADLKAGNAAKVPWVRVFDPQQSPNPTTGWYVVLLFSADGLSAALSLNQGVTRLSTAEIAHNVSLARRLLSAHPTIERARERLVTTITLNDPGLGSKYEKGHILGFEYQVTEVPDDDVIAEDINWLLDRLLVLPPGQDDATVLGIDPTTDDLDLSAICDAIYWTPGEVSAVFEGLVDESPQIVLTGPPGTGKTFVAQQLAAYLLGTPGEAENNPYIEIVQFHPSYGYEDFVEGLRPFPSEGGGLEFRNQPGVLLRLVDDMAADGRPRVLIIDEMNRANLPRVFGELMYLLEYRDQDIRLMHREKFSLPRNLYIIGTMNTADRNAMGLDIALRRRFDFYELLPRTDILRKYFDAPGRVNEVGEELFLGFDALNAALVSRLDRHFQVGHSYFMTSQMSRGMLHRIWDRQVLPLIEDYFYDRPSLLEEFTFDTFWRDV